VTAIRETFPEDTFLLEEPPQATPGPDGDVSVPTTADSVPESGPGWIVDPVDGTSNFVRGMRTWTTSVAAVVDGQAVGSATVLPSVEDVYVAGPDSVTRNDEPIEVSDREDPGTFAVTVVGGWDSTDRSVFANLADAVVERFGDMRRIGSFQATLGHVAAGGLEAAVAPAPTLPWDTVAGVHMIRQAGGTVTDVHGDPWTPAADGLVASNGRAHDALLAAARVARESP
jgi:myo-inositol-1(or 4)-monophosphatase